MKWIKLFEDFNEKEDPIWILISSLDPILVEILEVDEYGDVSMFNFFKLSQKFDKNKIPALVNHLSSEGYSITSTKPSDKMVIYEGDLETLCLKWLNENFKDVNKVNRTYYVFDEEGTGKCKLLFYQYSSGASACYFNYSKIWSFFQKFLLLENDVISDILNTWLKSRFDIRYATPKSGNDKGNVVDFKKWFIYLL